MQKIKYFISTINFSPFTRKKISSVLPKMIDKGIKNIEISSFHPFEKNMSDMLVDFSENADILLHNYAPPVRRKIFLNLSSMDGDAVLKSKGIIKDRILLTKQLGGDYYSFHAGARVDYVTSTHEYETRLNKYDAMDLSIKGVKDILKFAEQRQIHIGVENHVATIENKDNLILYDIDDWEKIFREIDSKYFHLHLDIGHLKVSAMEQGFNPNTFLEKFGDKVWAVHAHDNTGLKIDCHAPFTEDFWFGKKEWKTLNNLRYVILETMTLGDMELIYKLIRKIERDLE